MIWSNVLIAPHFPELLTVASGQISCPAESRSPDNDVTMIIIYPTLNYLNVTCAGVNIANNCYYQRILNVLYHQVHVKA